MIVKTYRTITGSLIPIPLYRQLKRTQRELYKAIHLSADLTHAQTTNLYIALSQVEELIPKLEKRNHAHDGS